MFYSYTIIGVGAVAAETSITDEERVGEGVSLRCLPLQYFIPRLVFLEIIFPVISTSHGAASHAPDVLFPPGL